MTTARRSSTANPDSTATVPRIRSRPSDTVTLRRVLGSELVKFLTLRSFRVGLGIAVLLIVGIGILTSLAVVLADSPADPTGGAPTADPTGGAAAGASAAMVAVAAVGILAVTSEYSTNTIRATFVAVPRRILVVLAKTLVLTVTTGLVTGLVLLVTFLIAQAILGTEGVRISLADPGVARAVLGSALYLTGVTAMASGFGWLLRNTSGALSVLLGVLVGLPLVGLLLPAPMAQVVVPYLPNNAGTAIMQLTPGGMLPPWIGFGVFSLYTLTVLAAAVLAVRHRDA